MVAKKIRLLVISVLILAAVIPSGWHWGLPAYRRFKEQRAVARARQFLEQGDYANASLAARTALTLNTNNVQACRVMAALKEMANSPFVMDWRRRVADIEPTVENKLMLVATGLRHQPPPFVLSAQVLEELAPVASNTPAFHVVSAEYAIKLNRLADAERHFAAAVALEPTNRLHQLNLADLHLRSTNMEVAASARARLTAFRSDTNLAPAALRCLADVALERKEFNEAKTYSEELVRTPGATIKDQLQHLWVLRQLRDVNERTYLAEVQTRTATNLPGIYILSTWMSQHDEAAGAIQWLRELPSGVRTQRLTQIALNDCYVTQQDWQSVQSHLKDQDWDELNFVRCAYQSLAAEKLKSSVATDAYWRSALREAGDRLSALMVLLNMTERWGRKTEREDLLWKIYERHPKERWAYFELNKHYLRSGNTRGLNRLTTLALNSEPANLVFKNDLAATSLLLKVNLTKAHELADEVYAAAGTNCIIATTYAFSRHLRGKTLDGLKVFDQMSRDDLASPPVALYRAILLCAAGQTNEAAGAIAIASKAVETFLPEERTLLKSCSR